MDRREFLKVAGAATAWVLAGCSDAGTLTSSPTTAPAPPTSAAVRRPNLVLIMADDLGYETLGAYGGVSYATPHLDRLAASGLRFEHAYSNPMCQPTRVKLLTGKYNFRNYIPHGELTPDQHTWAHALQAAGYATCAVGKWQLNIYGNGTPPEAAGFDEHCMWNVEPWRDGLDDPATIPVRYWNPEIVVNGEKMTDTEGRYGPDIFTEYGIDFVERHRDEPFLLYFPTNLPHSPHQPPPGHPNADAQIPSDSNDPVYYAPMVEYLDGLVGRIVAGLERLGLREDTIVMFTGDNGTPSQITSSLADGAPIKGAKASLKDGGIHVPLIANWPGTIAAGVTDALVDYSDWFPTIAELTGAHRPEDLDGVSFAPVLLNGDAGRREWVFVYFWRPDGGLRGWFAADRAWKLHGDGRLIDLSSDRRERRPVLEGSSPEADAARTRLQGVLDDLLAGVDHNWPPHVWRA